MPHPNEPHPPGKRGTAAPEDRKPKTLSPSERRNIFVHMVRLELKQGPISFARRRQLARFARDIGINRLDAAAMVAETLRNFGGEDGAGDKIETALELIRRPTRWPAWMRLSLAVGCGLLLRFLLLRCWFA